jgi:hypothetical protein
MGKDPDGLVQFKYYWLVSQGADWMVFKVREW